MRHLTKSRFKIGSSCPTKLYYTDRKEYGNKNDQDEFLKALADGGFQVGELAKLYYKGGVGVETLDKKQALEQTRELLKKDNVIIYEPAFEYDNLFIRVDILKKSGSTVELIEVKAKSFDSTEDFEAFDKRAIKKGEYRLKADWDDYLLDLAFQTHVVRLATKYKVIPFLLMADKSKMATVDGLNQLFLILRNGEGRPVIKVNPKAYEVDLGQRLLTPLPLIEVVDNIIEKVKVEYGPTFKDLVSNLSKIMKADEKYSAIVGSHCKGCEFKIDPASFSPEKKSGFQECWQSAKKLKDDEFKREFVFDVWNFRKSEDLIAGGTIFAKDITEDEVGIKQREDEKQGYSTTERQLAQIIAARSDAPKPMVRREELAAEIAEFKAPYHFIDFETTMVAIPFHAGRKPYEQIAFQFSHHVVYADGRLEHKTQYLNSKRGEFPNFEFIRNLKQALEGDNGTVFRFAAHENTVMNQIHRQLDNSSEKDKVELMAWIETLATPSKDHENPWTPKRQFIDMRDLTLRLYYLPETRGSNSIKKVLPAVLNTASQSVLNKFQDWIVRDPKTLRVKDPYKLLKPIFDDVDPAALERIEARLIEADMLNDGGAAMMAWSRMQFTEMSETERKQLHDALLRYCGLDTLAMVMIWEWWQEEIGNVGKAAVA